MYDHFIAFSLGYVKGAGEVGVGGGGCIHLFFFSAIVYKEDNICEYLITN